MAGSSQGAAAVPSSRPELVLERVLDAPRALVFQVWTDPQHLAAWWGPHGFTSPVCEVDLRPGGTLRIVMRAPDGSEHAMEAVFREIVAPERLVFTSLVPDAHGSPIFEVLHTITFAEQDGRTRLTMRARVLRETPAAAPFLAGMEEGWQQTLERLTAYVQRA